MTVSKIIISSELRQRAEAELQKIPVGHSSTPDLNLQKLLHELQVHQIELEMQNQALLDAQEEIARHLEEFTNLYDLAPVAYFTLSRNGQITRSNTLAKKLLDSPLHNLEGLRFSRFVSLDSLPVFSEFLTNIFLRGRLEYCTLQLEKPNTNTPIYVFIEGIVDDAGNQCRLTLTDLTQQKKSESLIASLKARTSELAMAKEAADAANAAKTAFLANMSHEIRTPMNAILGTVHLMHRDSLTPAQEKQLHTIDAASKHLMGVINDILDLAKIDADCLVLDKTDFHLNSILSNVHELISDKLQTKSLKLVFNVEATLTAQTLIGDPLRVQQIILNLVSNAVKFTNAGEIEVRAKINRQIDHAVFIDFAVQDSGCGIPSDALERIFNPFEQVDSLTTRKHGGTGLGLAICQRLIRLMGGEIKVSSTLGQGSTFSFSVALGKQEVIDNGTHEPKGMTAEEAEAILKNQCRSKRILLVEDDEINQLISIEILKTDIGLQVDVAGNGAEAVGMAEKTAYDLILMDMQMPVMDGVTATRAIRRLPGYQPIPIIAMTANAFADDRQHCLDAGMDDFIAKPVDPDKLFILLAEKLRVA